MRHASLRLCPSPPALRTPSPSRRQAGLEGKGDLDSAAFLMVSGVWAPGTLIESPVLYTKDDGTQVREIFG